MRSGRTGAGRPRSVVVALCALVLPVAGCNGSDRAEPGPSSSEPSSSETAPSGPSQPEQAEPEGGPTGTTGPAPTDAAPPDPVSILGLAEQEHRGDRLRLGEVRESTASYTSYDITYRVTSTGPGTGGRKTLRLSGVLNVPTGPGPFPAVVLAHGYVDPAYYVSGQGMTRERGYLADRGYVALHVDYRNHSGSDDDPDHDADYRLGYVVDVIGAVDALRRADLPVDDDRVALMGRSMGGGVVQQVATVAPGLVGAIVPWASISSLQGQNFDHFVRPGSEPRREAVVERRGLPEDDPDFWRGISPRPYFDRITERCSRSTAASTTPALLAGRP